MIWVCLEPVRFIVNRLHPILKSVVTDLIEFISSYGWILSFFLYKQEKNLYFSFLSRMSFY
jgi:hypothetical protein